MTAGQMAISFDVVGWPPTKNEATSLLAASHPHAPRVRALLEAAGLAAQRIGWTSTSGDLALHVVVRGPTRPPSDATNFLGGIGDVLQHKVPGRSPDLTHLAELRDFSLYADDRQMRQINYAEEHAAEPSYSVSIGLVGPGSSAAPSTVTTEAPTEMTASERGRRVVAA